MPREEKDPTNDKGQYHGYQEWFDINGYVYCRGNRSNGELLGYNELYIDEMVIFFIR